MQLNIVVVGALDPKRPVRALAPLEQYLTMSDWNDIVPCAMHYQHRRCDLGHLERDALGESHILKGRECQLAVWIGPLRARRHSLN